MLHTSLWAVAKEVGMLGWWVTSRVRWTSPVTMSTRSSGLCGRDRLITLLGSGSTGCASMLAVRLDLEDRVPRDGLRAGSPWPAASAVPSWCG